MANARLEEVSPGRYVVSGVFSIKAAALAAFARLTDGPWDSGFEAQTDMRQWGPPIDPPEHHATEASMPPFEEELPPRTQALMDLGDEEAPVSHLKAGEADRTLNLPGEDAE